MANRIKILCLGATMAPYSTNVPPVMTGQISEYLSFNVSQLELGLNTTSAQQTAYPLALSYFNVKYVLANHFTSGIFFTNITQDQLNSLANT